MGNCSQKGVVVAGESCTNTIKLVTESEGIIELKGPKLAIDVLNGYPGYGIFREGDASFPLGSHEYLIGGQFYYLLPLQELPLVCDSGTHEVAAATPRKENIVALPSQENGVWKVKLVINTQELEQILSEEGNTEALIEKMRMAAASSASFAPTNRRKSNWGVGTRAKIFNVFKVSPINRVK